MVKKVAIIMVFFSLFVVKPVIAQNEGIVTRYGTRFTLRNELFHFSGANTYYLMVYAAQGVKGNPAYFAYVDEVLEEAASMGLRVVRTWAFNDGASQWNALQLSPGLYDEQVFKALDYVLYKADLMGIRLILPLVNNWDDYGGMNQYVEWSPTTNKNLSYDQKHNQFYTDENTRRYYKAHVSAVLNRVNTYNGRTYKNDPTVFAWELANEPRAQDDYSGDLVYEWIVEMSRYIKSLEPLNMVTTGLEGFYSGRSGGWMYDGYTGTDFIRDHNVPEIDFATVHLWPESWGFDNTQAVDWVKTHINEAHNVLGKPVIIEEFGRWRDDGRATTMRDALYQSIYDAVYESRAGGSNFWILYHDAYPDYDGFGVYYPADSSTIQIIEDAAFRMNSLRDLCSKGDYDLSGEVNILDIIQILRFSAGIDQLPDFSDRMVWCACDINDDSSIDIQDVIKALRIVSGLN